MKHPLVACSNPTESALSTEQWEQYVLEHLQAGYDVVVFPVQGRDHFFVGADR